MTVEEQLKQEILSKYKSIRAFTTTINIPYSTLDSVFKRGISNAGVSTMIKVFDALELDIESVQTGTLQRKPANGKNSPGAPEAAPEESVLALFDSLRTGLISTGLIRDGEDITEQQAQVLISVCRILDAVFQ